MDPQAPGQPAPPPPLYAPPRSSPFARVAKFFATVSLILGCLIMGVILGFYASFFVGKAGPASSTWRAGEGTEKIAIIPIDGIISDSMVGFVHRVVEEVLADSQIRAVVLRVESPGGGATASDEIHHELLRLRSEGGLPIIASYGDMAASGGYYVSCLADVIYTQPTTLTGSIGVIAPYMTIEKLLEKVGVTPEILTSTAASDKDSGSMFRAWTDKDRDELRKMLDAVQERFVEIVAEGRKNVMSLEQVRSVATGRALMGADAKAVGLVDEIGYLDAALERARTAAGITAARPPVVIYHQPISLTDFVGLRGEREGQSLLSLDPEALRQMMGELMTFRRLYMYTP